MAPSAGRSCLTPKGLLANPRPPVTEDTNNLAIAVRRLAIKNLSPQKRGAATPSGPKCAGAAYYSGIKA